MMTTGLHIIDKRAVAFLDILGFRQMIKDIDIKIRKLNLAG